MCIRDRLTVEKSDLYAAVDNSCNIFQRGIPVRGHRLRRLDVYKRQEEVLQHKERHYKLHAYEQAVASLLTSFPSISSSRIGDYLRDCLLYTSRCV